MGIPQALTPGAKEMSHEKMTTHLHLELGLRTCEAIPSLYHRFPNCGA